MDILYNISAIKTLKFQIYNKQAMRFCRLVATSRELVGTVLLKT